MPTHSLTCNTSQELNISNYILPFYLSRSSWIDSESQRGFRVCFNNRPFKYKSLLNSVENTYI